MVAVKERGTDDLDDIIRSMVGRDLGEATERPSTASPERDVCIPIFASANLLSADAHNAELIARYRKRIRHF